MVAFTRFFAFFILVHFQLNLIWAKNNEFFPSSIARPPNHDEKFKILCIFVDGVPDHDKNLIRDACDYVNSKLGPIISGNNITLNDIRFDEKLSGNRCANVLIPDEFVLPSPDSDFSMNDISDNIKKFNEGNYSLVILIGIQALGSSDSNCAYFEKKNQNRPQCRWFGPAIMGIPCQFASNGRPTHGRLVFCKSPDVFAIDQGELNSVLLHEILHFTIGLMDQIDATKTKLVNRQWNSENGTSTIKTFAIVGTPNVLRAAKEYSRCDRIEGAEVPVRVINNQTPPFLKPIWDHWSFRLFPDDILAPHSSYGEKISKMTLGAVEDRGWYKADFDQAEELAVKNSTIKGCIMALKSCHKLIERARRKSDALYDIWPICDAGSKISTRCSPDGRQRFLCHQIEDYSCHALHSVACLGHHPLCSQATQQSPIFPNIEFTPDPDNICVTIANFPGVASETLSTEYSLPPCVSCRKNNTSVILVLNKKIPCEVVCPKAMANKMINFTPSEECSRALDPDQNGEKVAVICPDYDKISCRMEKASTTVTSTIPVTPTILVTSTTPVASMIPVTSTIPATPTTPKSCARNRTVFYEFLLFGFTLCYFFVKVF